MTEHINYWRLLYQEKITYHVKDNQLEVETNKYTYTAARNGSKEVGIQESDIAATLSADEYNSNRQTFEREYKYKSKCP